MADTLRTFIAIDIRIEELLKDKWINLKTLLRNDSIKWVDDKILHLTLSFLGETPISKINKISSKLEIELKNVHCFNITLKGIGTFGNPKAPKVIWVGVDDSEQIRQLYTIVNNCISEFGFQNTSEKFSPHITLGRVKHINSSDKLNQLINQSKEFKFQEANVDRVVFYQSILRSEGPIYKPLSVIRLLSL